MSDIVIHRLQLEAWAAAIRLHLDGDGQLDRLGLEQALEDMTDELADPDEIDICDDADLYDPDAPSDGWTPEDEMEDGDEYTNSECFG